MSGHKIHPVIFQDFRAMTIRQPYPWAIQRGLKRGETRSRSFSYRGWVGIHAAQRWAPGWGYGKWVDGWRDPSPDDDEATRRHDLLVDLGVDVTEDTEEGRWCRLDRWSLPLGAIVAVAEVIDCVPIIQDHEMASAPFAVATAHGNVHALREGYHQVDLDGEAQWGDFTPGRFMVLFGDVLSLARPVSAKGSLAMPWRVPEHVAAKVREQLEVPRLAKGVTP